MRRGLRIWALAAGLAFLGGSALWQQRAAAGPDRARVWVARVDIAEGKALEPADVQPRWVPRAYLLQDALESSGGSAEFRYSGLVARVAIPKGSQLGQALLASPAEAGRASAPPPSYRSFALEPANVELARLARWGDRVDVISVFERGGRGGRRRSAAVKLLANVLVLGADGGPSLDLALNPNEAQYLLAALAEGEVLIALRAYGDVEMPSGELASWEKLRLR